MQVSSWVAKHVGLPQCSWRQSRHAFTLIEVLVVIMLIAILLGVLVPRAEPNTYEQLQLAAHTVAADVEYARSLAVNFGQSVAVVFDPNTNSYAVTCADSAQPVKPISPFAEQNADGNGYTVHLENLPCLGPPVQLLCVADADNPGDQTSRIVFDPLGALQGGKTRRIWLCGGWGAEKRYITVTVDAVTGLVSVDDYTGSGPTSTP